MMLLYILTKLPLAKVKARAGMKINAATYNPAPRHRASLRVQVPRLASLVPN